MSRQAGSVDDCPVAEAEQSLPVFFEQMQNGVVYCKVLYRDGSPCDFVCLYANAAFHRQTGLGPVVGKHGSDVVPGLRDADPGLIEICGRVAASGVGETFEVYVESLNEWLFVQVFCPRRDYFVAVFNVVSSQKKAELHRAYLPLGQQAAATDEILATIEDVNSRNASEAELQRVLAVLRRSALHLNEAQKIANLGSWSWNIETGINHWSDQQFRMFGYQPGAISPSYDLFFERLYPEDRLAVNQAIEAALESDAVYDIEFRIVLPDGSIKHLHAHGQVERDAAGRPLHMTGTLLDISERRRSLERLTEVNRRLETLAVEQAKHLRELASALTHAELAERDRLYDLLHGDVQPLLVAARLSLSSLMTKDLPQNVRRVLTESCEHITEALEMTRSLGQQLSPPLIRERGLVAALHSFFSWIKKYHGLDVQLSMACAVEPDDIALRLLCFNSIRELLINVVKHAGASTASVLLEIVDCDKLQISIADDGCGFPSPDTTQGTGIANIKRRLDMFGGSLQLDYRAGQGALACLQLPLQPDRLKAGRQ